MDCFRIHGPKPLVGSAWVSGSKNAALPIMAASILACEPVRLAGVPHLADVRVLGRILRSLGMGVRRDSSGDMLLETMDPTRVTAPASALRRMRAGFCVLGALLARRGKAIVPLPGGCKIGPRPIDLHLRGLAALGADLSVRRGCVIARSASLRGAEIDLTGPHGPTVTGTANVLSAAVLARGRTVLRGAACEPEIVDLACFLRTLGAQIEGEGTPCIEIRGCRSLGGGAHRIIPDRIEAATFLIAAAATGGSISVRGATSDHMTAVLDLLSRTGAQLSTSPDRIDLSAHARPRAVSVTAGPYPGVPTDVQAQLTALAAVSRGQCTIRDLVFPSRFAHTKQLARMGAALDRQSTGLAVRGVPQLQGGRVVASDLRASAALVIAALAAHGQTTIQHVEHLERGYERLAEKLSILGASIERISVERRVRSVGQGTAAAGGPR